MNKLCLCLKQLPHYSCGISRMQCQYNTLPFSSSHLLGVSVVIAVAAPLLIQELCAQGWTPECLLQHHCQTCLRTPLPNTLVLIKSSSLHPSLALSSSLLLSDQSQVQDTANTAYIGANPARTPTWLHQSQLWSPSQERRSGHVSLFCQSWQCWEPYFWVVIISLYVFTLHSLQASVIEFLHLYIYIF